MTLSTSAVAVCCCSDSRSSLSRRVFSIAMTAWRRNSGQLDLLVGERTHLLTVDVDVANQLVVLEHRNEEKGSRRGKFDDADSRRIALLIGKLLAVVGNVNEVLRSHHTAKSIVRIGINQRVALSGLGEGGWRIMHRGNAEGIVFAELQSGEIGPANAHRVFQHSLEYRL